MATPASRLIQDQNLSILSNGAALGGKTGGTKADKKGGLSGRKALNDISNSRNAAVLQTKKDLTTSKTKYGVGGKVGGRKALGDVTNSVKPSSQVVPKKGLKLNPIAEESDLNWIKEEGFLHNHQECIKAERKAMAMDVDHLKSVLGLNNDNPILQSPGALVPSSKLVESPVKHLEMKEMPELLFEDRVSSGCSSPSWGSPKSPKLRFNDDIFLDFTLKTPKLLNP